MNGNRTVRNLKNKYQIRIWVWRLDSSISLPNRRGLTENNK